MDWEALNSKPLGGPRGNRVISDKCKAWQQQDGVRNSHDSDSEMGN